MKGPSTHPSHRSELVLDAMYVSAEGPYSISHLDSMIVYDESCVDVVVDGGKV